MCTLRCTAIKNWPLTVLTPPQKSGHRQNNHRSGILTLLKHYTTRISNVTVQQLAEVREVTVTQFWSSDVIVGGIWLET